MSKEAGNAKARAKAKNNASVIPPQKKSVKKMMYESLIQSCSSSSDQVKDNASGSSENTVTQAKTKVAKKDKSVFPSSP